MAKPKVVSEASEPTSKEDESYSEEALVKRAIRDSAEIKEALLSSSLPEILNIARVIAEGIERGNNVILFGNGGSAAEAEHFAAELVGRFKHVRQPFKALALTANSSLLTALGNDFGFEEIYSRQVRAHANKGDVVVAISTSGRSKNVLRGVEEARKRSAEIIGLIGQQGDLATTCDHSVSVPSVDAQRIQECHTMIIHIICDLVERRLVGENMRNESQPKHGFK